MFRKTLQRKAAAIEARNWQSVAHVMAADEAPVDYVATKRIFSDGEGLGHSYVTDQQLIVTAGPPPLDVIPLPWSKVRLYPMRDAALVVEVVTDDSPLRLTLKCAPGSRPLWDRVLPEMLERAGLGVGTGEDLRRRLDAEELGG